MTHHSHRFITTARLAVSASGLCLGLLLACGGNTENSSNDDTTGPTDGGPTDGGPTTNGSPTDGGPTTNGGPTTDGDSGGSGGVGGSGPTTDASSGGSGGGNNECPSVEPAAGSSCSEQSQVCAYANCVAPDYRNGHELECVNGAWLLASETVCEEVPIECPPNVYLGASCGSAEGTGPCTVYDACGVYRQVYCIGGYWQYPPVGQDQAPPPDGGGGGGAGTGAVGTGPGSFTSGPIPEPTCPPYAPTPGQACCPADYPAYCDYTGGLDPLPDSVATGASFTTVSTGAGGSSGSGGALPNLTCAVCGPNLTWEASDVCF